jgi:hypothetical protein
MHRSTGATDAYGVHPNHMHTHTSALRYLVVPKKSEKRSSGFAVKLHAPVKPPRTVVTPVLRPFSPHCMRCV